MREVGPQLRVRPLGVVPAHSFQVGPQVRHMLGAMILLTDEGDEVQPGDDVHDAQYRWWAIEALTAATILFHPSTPLWILQCIVALYRC